MEVGSDDLVFFAIAYPIFPRPTNATRLTLVSFIGVVVGELISKTISEYDGTVKTTGYDGLQEFSHGHNGSHNLAFEGSHCPAS